MSNEITVNAGNFEDEVLRSSVPVLIDFWASWCQPCKMISPFIDEIAGEYAGRLKVVKINVDEEAVNMMIYQNYYNAAARYMTTIDEALGVVIQQMGTVGR